MHFDEKSSSGSLWKRRVAGHVAGCGAGVSPPIRFPAPAQATTAPPGPTATACLRCALLTTPPSLILMSFLLSILPGLSNRSLIAINHLPKQMSGTMGLGRLEA